MMHLLRKISMLLLVVAVLLSLWLVAADHAESSRSLVLSPDGTVHHLDSIASNNTRPLPIEPGSVVSSLKSLLVSG